jgi:two-component system, response regulator PdtaR
MDRAKFDFCIGTADPAVKRQLITALSAAGFKSAGAGVNITELLRTLRSVQPWLVVVDINLPGNLEQLASIIEEDSLAAAIYIGPVKKRLEQYPRLPWPVDGSVLAAVAEALCVEFARKRKLRREIGSLKQTLAERREVEKAKGLLMKKLSLSEDEAFRYLRGSSMEQRISLIDAARQVLREK